MSRCYYVKCGEDNFVNLEKIQGEIQKCVGEKFDVHLDEYENEEGGCIYIMRASTRGIHVYKEKENIVVKINSLCNDYDYYIAKAILKILVAVCKQDAIDEEEGAINIDEYFSEKNIAQMRLDDCKTVLVAIENVVKDKMEIPGVVRPVYFGKLFLGLFKQHPEMKEKLVDTFDYVMQKVQWGLPDYNLPGKMMMRPKDYKEGEKYTKVRMMFSGQDYILTDYEYLMIGDTGVEGEIIFINNEDLCSIMPVEPVRWEYADDFTVVAPALDEEGWKKFVEDARKLNHTELLEAVQAAEPVNLTPDYNPDEDDEDENHISCQCHGDHWDCVLNDENEFNLTIKKAVEKSHLYGDCETSYNLDEPDDRGGRVIVLEHYEDEDSPICERLSTVPLQDSVQLVSAYPVIRQGVKIPLKIVNILEWTNKLEAWITGEIEDGRTITFFDADYAINKASYQIGKIYDFMIGALAYTAEEPETKGFDFEGQKAIDFKAKLGEEPDYDEDGNVKPLHFSTEKLCSFMQWGNHAPDEAEFISVVDDIKTVNYLGKSFYNFGVIFRTEDEEEDIVIPCFYKIEDDTPDLSNATQLQGVLWLCGFLSE